MAINLSVRIVPAITAEDTKIFARSSGPATFIDQYQSDWGISSLKDILNKWHHACGIGNGSPFQYYYTPDSAGGDWNLKDAKYETVVLDGDGNVQKDHADSVPSAKIAVEVQSSGVSSIRTEPVIIDRQIFDTRGSKLGGDFTAEISDSVTKSVSTSWEESTSVGVSVTVGVEVGSEALGAKASASTTLSVDKSWGQGGSEEKAIQVGNNSSVQVNLDPDELGMAALTLNRGSMNIQVVYEAKVTGYIQAIWQPALGTAKGLGGNAWYSVIPFADMLRKAGMKDTIIARQNIQCDYFADGVLVVTDLPDTKGATLDDRSLPKGSETSHEVFQPLHELDVLHYEG